MLFNLIFRLLLVLKDCNLSRNLELRFKTVLGFQNAGFMNAGNL